MVAKVPMPNTTTPAVMYIPVSLDFDLSLELVSEIEITVKVNGELLEFSNTKFNLVLSFIYDRLLGERQE